MDKQVSWRDGEGIEGFGTTTQEDVNELNKALTAGQDQNPPGSVVAGDGFALRVESLEASLKSTTFKSKHFVLWKNLTKLPAYNTVEEYNQIQQYGDGLDQGFIDEGDLPSESDSSYERKFSVVKYIGTTRRVTHVMSLVKPAHGNVIARETVNGTMHILRIMEKALFKGDSSLSSLQFDGFEKLITDGAPAANIIDLRGAPLSEDRLTDGALTIHDAPNFGLPTDIYCNPKVKSDLAKTFFPKERTSPGESMGRVGLTLDEITTEAGDVRLHGDVFIDDGGAPSAAFGDASLRPATPTISTPATTPVDGASQFAAEDDGSYFYEVQAVNRYGRSASVDVGGGAIAVAAGDKMTFGVTPGSAVVVDWYELFRTKVDGADGTERLILRVPSAGAGETTIDDLNAKLPGTTNVYMFQQDVDNMAYRQLAPLVKIPLATIDTSIRWMQLLYGVPQLYTPGKNVLYINVGRSANFVGQP